MKRSMILLMSLVLFLQAACSDRDLQKASKSMVVLASAIGELQKDVIAANEQKLLSDQAAGEILEVCLKINAAGKQIDAVLRSVRQLEFIAGIQDPAMKQKTDAVFVLVRTTVSSLQIILASMASSGG